MITFPIVVIGVIVLYLLNSIKILREYERGVIFRLGRVLSAPKGPGIILVFAPFDRIVRVSLRLVTMDIPPQDVITKDNVSVKVNAVVYYRVMDASKAILQVENFYFATSQLSQTTLRSVLGKMELDDLLSNRDKINMELQHILDQDTEPWGVKVAKVEVKNVDLPVDMQRAMAKQAEAERERRAKIINAEGESILLNLDMEGIAASTGSACTSGSLEPSHVLISMGLKPEECHGSVRFTLGRETTEKEIDKVLAVMPKIIEKLRKMSPLNTNG